MAQTRQRQNNRKQEIVAAAESLLRRKGLAGVTTRAIAAAVPCSEGAIYVHFKGRLELLLAALEGSLADMLVPLKALDSVAGMSTPQRNLSVAVKGLQAFHLRVVPMLGALFAEPELLAGFRETLLGKGGGPHQAIHRLTSYIRAEQKLQRISGDVDAAHAATTLMSVCFFQAFTQSLLGSETPRVTARALVVATLSA